MEGQKYKAIIFMYQLLWFKLIAPIQSFVRQRFVSKCKNQ